jgi:hypothetical protein
MGHRREEPRTRYPTKEKSSGQTGKQPKAERTREPMTGIPRGLQIMPSGLPWGFPFYPALLAYGITRSDWERFSGAMASIVCESPLEIFPVEELCDIVADWGKTRIFLTGPVLADYSSDKTYFRSKGLVVRVDMPGGREIWA